MAVVDGEEAGGETKRLHIVQEEEEAEGKVGGGNIQKRLMFAVKKGNVEAFRELIKQGASVKVMDAYVPQEKEQKSASLWSWLTCSAEKEEQDPAPAITEDYPLHVAASEGNVDLIEAIVDLGADLEAKNRMGSTALHRAVSAGQLVAAEKLIDLGASIDTTNNIGNTALHVAVFCGHKKIVQLLLSNGAYAQLHTPNKLAYTPLSYAKGRNIIAQMLKEYKPSDAESKQKTQHTGQHSVDMVAIQGPGEVDLESDSNKPNRGVSGSMDVSGHNIINEKNA
eukprot:g20227.t1